MKTNRLLLIALAVTLSFFTRFAFTLESDCINPIEAQLVGNETMKFCEIPAAKGIVIGSYDGDDDQRPGPARDFNSFHIGQYEVTQLQFKISMGYEPWKNSDDGSLKKYVREGDSNPAVYVPLKDIEKFANILSNLDENATYRLPTEAEWEYAARGQKNRDANYYWGNKIDQDRVYYWGNSKYRASYARSVYSCPQPLLNDRRPGYCANDYGLMHMLGNVWEWTADIYVYSYAKAPADGHVAVTSDSSDLRVIRGGSWGNSAPYVSSTNRYYSVPDGRSDTIGFRLVRIAK